MSTLPNSNEILDQLLDLKSKIEKVLRSVDFDSSNIILENKNDPNELFIREKCKSILNRLDDINFEIEYLARPIIEEGVLYKKSNGRYSINGNYEFTSGSLVEVFVNGEWILTRVEHTDGDYYFYDLKNIPMDGSRVRRR
jgi:hypothetical protein